MSRKKLDVRSVLDEQSAEIERMAVTANNHINDIYQLQQYMTNRVKGLTLTADQQALMKLYEFIYNQLMGGQYTESEVVELAMIKSGSSRPQAIGYVSEAKELFNTTISVNKKFALKRELQLNEIYRQRCVEMGDMKSAAAFSKIIEKLLANIEDEDNRADTFTGHVLQVSADPQILGIAPSSKKEIAQLLAELKEKFGYGDKDIEDAEILHE